MRDFEQDLLRKNKLKLIACIAFAIAWALVMLNKSNLLNSPVMVSPLILLSVTFAVSITLYRDKS